MLDIRRSEFVEGAGRATAVTSPTFTQALRDIPQTIAVIPREIIQSQGATSLRDNLRNVPGITFQAGEGGGLPGDNFTMRGFSAGTDMFIDGVRDPGGGQNLADVQYVDRVGGGHYIPGPRRQVLLNADFRF